MVIITTMKYNTNITKKDYWSSLLEIYLTMYTQRVMVTGGYIDYRLW